MFGGAFRRVPFLRALIRRGGMPKDAEWRAFETSYSPTVNAPRRCDNLRARIWCARLRRDATVPWLHPMAAAISSYERSSKYFNRIVMRSLGFIPEITFRTEASISR